MFRLKNVHRPLLAIGAAGALGLFIYGVSHSVNAYNDSGQSLSHDNISVVSTGKGSVDPGGNFCNPYGCAGCSGCISLQYQQNAKDIPASTADLQIE